MPASVLGCYRAVKADLANGAKFKRPSSWGERIFIAPFGRKYLSALIAGRQILGETQGSREGLVLSGRARPQSLSSVAEGYNLAGLIEPDVLLHVLGRVRLRAVDSLVLIRKKTVIVRIYQMDKFVVPPSY